MNRYNERASAACFHLIWHIILRIHQNCKFHHRNLVWKIPSASYRRQQVSRRQDFDYWNNLRVVLLPGPYQSYKTYRTFSIPATTTLHVNLIQTLTPPLKDLGLGETGDSCRATTTRCSGSYRYCWVAIFESLYYHYRGQKDNFKQKIVVTLCNR